MPWYPPPTEAVIEQREELKIVPTPSQYRVITSPATIVAAWSSAGEGKSWACIMATLFHAAVCGARHLQAAIIRDTHTNNKRTVVKAWKAFFEAKHIEHRWRGDDTQLSIDSDPLITIDFIGVDNLDAITSIQGSEYGLIWLEEPCAYTTSLESNAGLSEDLYNAALARCARQQDSRAKLLLSFNPPDDDHWVARRILNAPDGMVHPSTPLITKETIHFPPGENIYLKEESRQAAKAAYIHDPVAYARFVTGEVATKYPGKPVCGRSFNKSWHVAPGPLEPVEGLVGFVGWDSWGNPAAILGQQWPDGRLWILDECLDGEDVRDLLVNQLNPLVASPRWKDKCYSWRQIGDRTMRQPDQSSANTCAADVVEENFDPGMDQRIPFELGPQTWQHMRLGLMHALGWAVRGQPAILIDPQRCKRLIAGLSGRWHYPTNKAGVITQTHPLKDEYCVDEKTEILTFQGWKTFDQLEEFEQVYAFDIDKQALAPATVLAINIYDACEHEYDVLHFSSANFDMVVTPDHKCVARTRSTTRRPSGGVREIFSPYGLVAAKDLHTGHRLLAAPSLLMNDRSGERIAKDREFSDEFIRLCAWVMTEGQYHPTGGIVLSQSRGHNPQYIQELEDLRAMFPTSIFEKSDIYTTTPRRDKIITSYRIAVRREIGYLVKQLMPSKYPSPEFIRLMTTSQKRLFLYEAIKGDGDWGPQQKYVQKIERNRDFWTDPKTPRICCGKKEEADAIQTIATLIGMRSHIHDGTDADRYAFPSQKWLVSLMRKGDPHVVALEKSHESVPLVWCPTTTTGTWIARRNGTVFVTGNSHSPDALTNAICILAPWTPLQQNEYTKRRTAPRHRRAFRQLAASYSTNMRALP